MMQGIKDKVVVITGASSGLGEAAARLLAKDGAKLVLGARRLDRLRALSLILCVAISTAFTARRPRYPPGRSVSGAR